MVKIAMILMYVEFGFSNSISLHSFITVQQILANDQDQVLIWFEIVYSNK